MYIFCRPDLQVPSTDLTEVRVKTPTNFNKTGLGQCSGNSIQSNLLFVAWLTGWFYCHCKVSSTFDRITKNTHCSSFSNSIVFPCLQHQNLLTWGLGCNSGYKASETIMKTPLRPFLAELISAVGGCELNMCCMPSFCFPEAGGW